MRYRVGPVENTQVYWANNGGRNFRLAVGRMLPSLRGDVYPIDSKQASVHDLSVYLFGGLTFLAIERKQVLGGKLL